jgi:REP element-mobilizing transposase RayT
MKKEPKIYYKSRLPHIVPVGASFFVTFRLADSLPQKIVQALKLQLEDTIIQLKKDKPNNHKELIRNEKKRFFGKYDHQLDNKPYGECFLKRKEIANIVQEQLHRFDNDLYELACYSIMPNHVHILIDTAIQVVDYEMVNGKWMSHWLDDIPNNFKELDEIMRRIKGASAYYCNKLLRRTGQSFWQKDSYDHFIRNEKEWNNILNYILQNPVKAGFCQEWQDWKFTYIKP